MDALMPKPESRYLIHWRAYVYVNKLYSLPKGEVRGFRNLKPVDFSRDLNEMIRVQEFANRDLSVLLFHKRTDLANVRDVILPNLLFGINMKSLEFRIALSPYIGSRTNHFVQELINYARSPYGDPVSYEFNVKYRSELAVDGAVLHNFVEFSKRVDENEYVSEPLYSQLYVQDASGETNDLTVLDNGMDATLLQLHHLSQSFQVCKAQTAQKEPARLAYRKPSLQLAGDPRRSEVNGPRLTRLKIARKYDRLRRKRWNLKDQA
ncbi:E3 ubiquitin-protein ligase Topors [Drosophila grimshawi]|uniref:RING-type E3 ubiquitin transferase n=1 Tax=Drosophila grimshawi TaxID=7222 RepID=B4J4L1_DROGR|nr:E3 ubiquitin-protein ligase Topors [Drosophila grimshawi]EDW02716.1 GH22137 [Drosophila grimshawi]